MKITLLTILFLAMMVLSSFQLSSEEWREKIEKLSTDNKQRDYHPSSAPPMNHRLDFSKTNIFMSGLSYVNFEKMPMTVYHTANVSYNASKEEYFASIGATHVLANQTGAWVLLRAGSENCKCFSVKNYTWSVMMSEFTHLRRIGSIKMNLPWFKEQIDDALGVKSKVSKEADEIDGDIFDIYYGTYRDIGSPGGWSGCITGQQLPTAFFVNRYAAMAYNQTIGLKSDNTQFFPLVSQMGLSDRNWIDSGNYYYSFLSTSIPSDPHQLFDQYCQGAPDYCQYLFNTGCPFPQQPQIECHPQKPSENENTEKLKDVRQQDVPL